MPISKTTKKRITAKKTLEGKKESDTRGARKSMTLPRKSTTSSRTTRKSVTPSRKSVSKKDKKNKNIN